DALPAQERARKVLDRLNTFVLAVLGYCDVAKKIKPKRDRVAKLEHEYQTSKRELDKIDKELAQLSQNVERIYEKATNQKFRT
uniref:hypothetical protein n=1 Tax=Salmonella sp. s51228 TaxID=3159652 RepID=UPI00397EFAE4